MRSIPKGQWPRRVDGTDMEKYVDLDPSMDEVNWVMYPDIRNSVIKGVTSREDDKPVTVRWGQSEYSCTGTSSFPTTVVN